MYEVSAPVVQFTSIASSQDIGIVLALDFRGQAEAIHRREVVLLRGDLQGVAVERVQAAPEVVDHKPAKEEAGSIVRVEDKLECIHLGLQRDPRDMLSIIAQR